jgi:hypothetical protein
VRVRSFFVVLGVGKELLLGSLTHLAHVLVAWMWDFFSLFQVAAFLLYYNRLVLYEICN